MAPYRGYDPMSRVPDYSGLSSAVSNLSGAVGSAVALGEKISTTRESNASMYAKTAAFLSDPDLAEMPANMKQVPSPRPGEDPAQYEARITQHMKNAVEAYSKVASDPTKLGRVAQKVESQFKDVGNDVLAQKSLQLQYGNQDPTGATQQQNDVSTLNALPEQVAAPMPGESTADFNKRQSAAFYADRKMADPYSDVRPAIDSILNDPTATAKEKTTLLTSVLRWDMQEKRAEEAKQKEQKFTASENQKNREAKSSDKLLDRNSIEYRTAVNQLAAFIGKGGKVYSKETGNIVENADVSTPELYLYGEVVKPVTTMNYIGKIDKNGSVVINGMTYNDKDIQNIRTQTTGLHNVVQKAETDGRKPAQDVVDMIDHNNAIITAYDKARYGGLMQPGQPAETPPASPTSTSTVDANGLSFTPVPAAAPKYYKGYKFLKGTDNKWHPIKQ